MPLILPIPPVQVATSSLPNATVNAAYSFQMTASGGTGAPYTWTASGLPSGLSISNGGLISGTPTVSGSFNPTFTATDSFGASPPTAISFTVAALPAFNFFISPTGVDTNPGTLAQPWSLSAFTSKMSTYFGRSVGLIADQGSFQFTNTGSGPISIYSQIQAYSGGNANGALFQVDGGTSNTSRTVVSFSDSFGNYLPRGGVIDPRDPATLTLPTAEVGLIGQSNANPTGPYPSHVGNITFDGLVIAYPTNSGIIVAAGAALNNVTIQNCELYAAGPSNPQVVGNHNPAAIKIVPVQGGSNIQVLNNKIHDFNDATGPGSLVPWDYHGILVIEGAANFFPVGVTIKNNTCYNIGTGISFKDTNAPFGEVSYNYLDVGSFGSAQSDGSTTQAIRECSTWTGQTLTFHHNICLGQISTIVVSGTVNNNAGNVIITNNTIYGPQQPLSAFRSAVNTSNPGTFTWQSNLIYTTHGNQSGIGTVMVDQSLNGLTGITPSSCNFNYYYSGANFQFGPQGQPIISQGTWQNPPNSFDVGSVFGGNPFGGTPTALQPATFAVTSVAIVNGVTCGAVDGSGSIGCNF